MVRMASALSLTLSVLFMGCQDATAPDDILEIGRVGFFNEEDPFITVPDTVDSGVPFTLVVRTYGNGCVRLGPTEVVQGVSTAIVVPHDYRRVSDLVCDDSLNSFDHETTLVFSMEGRATVTIEGRVTEGEATQAFSRLVWVR